MTIYDLLNQKYMIMFPEDDGTGDAGGSDDSADDSDDSDDSADNKNPDDKTPDKEPDKEPDKGDKEPDKGAMWSDDWRQEYAKEDKKTLAYLSRFTSPKTLIDKIFAQEKMISSGKHVKKAPEEGATDEEKTAYRKEIGVPETTDGYLDALPDGLVLGEDEKVEAADYLQTMHDANAPPELVAIGLKAFNDHLIYHQELRGKNDLECAENAQQELKEEWGNDYERNVTAMENFIIRNFPNDVQDAMMNGRLGDDGGTPLLADTRVIKAFAQIERELNPQNSTVSSRGVDTVDSVNDQIKIYENRMTTDRTKWFKDEKSQKHLQELYRAQERFKARGQ